MIADAAASPCGAPAAVGSKGAVAPISGISLRGIASPQAVLGGAMACSAAPIATSSIISRHQTPILSRERRPQCATMCAARSWRMPDDSRAALRPSRAIKSPDEAANTAQRISALSECKRLRATICALGGGASASLGAAREPAGATVTRPARLRGYASSAVIAVLKR